MRKQHGIRHWLLASLVVLVAAFAALGSGLGASAAEAPLPDFGSKEAFERECERLGGDDFGEVGEPGEDGAGTYCLVEGWAWIECDLNGNSCTLYTAGRPSGDANSPDGTGEQNAPDEGGTGYPGLPGETPPETLPNLPGAND